MKALIKIPQRNLKGAGLAPFNASLFLISLALLPYLFYVSMVGILVVLINLIRTFRKPCLDPLTMGCLIATSGLMILSAARSPYPGEAFLQLSNFLPYMLMFAYLPGLFRTAALFERLAIALVLTAIPINLIAVGEYLLKSPRLPESWQAIAWIESIHSAPHAGRAMTLFDHPNVMASYLVIVLGLGLGMVALQRIRSLAVPIQPKLFMGMTLLNLVGIFCTGSRNGLAIALTQLFVFVFVARLSRRMIAILAGVVGAIALGTVTFGLGVRRISILNITDDPRVGLWKIALDLIQQRPWLGWGLGSFKFLYPPRLIDPEYQNVFHPHNIWLLLGAEAGLLVMIVVTLMVAFVCYRAVRYGFLRESGSSELQQYRQEERAIATAYLLAFWGCIGFALFDITFYDVRTNALNWTILAVLYATPYCCRENPLWSRDALSLKTDEHKKVSD